MNQYRRTLAAAIGLLPLTACVPAFQVTKGTEPKGIPFYVKSEVHRHHSTYQYDWWRVSLTHIPVIAEASGTTPAVLGPKSTRVKDVAATAANRAALDNLRNLIDALPAVPARDPAVLLKQITDAFAALDPVPDNHVSQPDAKLLRLTSNFVERVSVVDYSRTYYLNGRIPPFGSNNLNTELAADGTLAKGSTTVSGGVGDAIGSIASAITGIAPIKEFLTTRWTPAPKAEGEKFLPGAGDPDRARPFRMELAVEGQALTFDFTKDYTSAPTLAGPLPADFAGGTFTSRTVDKPAEKAAEEGITFAGKVVMPPAKKP